MGTHNTRIKDYKNVTLRIKCDCQTDVTKYLNQKIGSSRRNKKELYRGKFIKINMMQNKLTNTEFEKVCFDGYCPESMLEGKKVEMKLNEDDFWESIETGLQMTVFPPFATILRWRGKGNFRESSEVASNTINGLILTEAQIEEGKEIFPNEKEIIAIQFDLEFYLQQIYDSKEEFDAAKFNPNDPIFEKQKDYLATLKKSNFKKMFKCYDDLKKEVFKGHDLIESDNFQKFYDELCKLELIFPFKWMSWTRGTINLNNKDYDFKDCSLLELSMYITYIFRADKFTPGTKEEMFKTGMFDKIFINLKENLT